MLDKETIKPILWSQKWTIKKDLFKLPGYAVSSLF